MNELTLLGGIDVPFPQAGLIIHQPTLREIAYVGEEDLFLACKFLNITKNDLSPQDRADLEDKTNFYIIVTMINQKSLEIQRTRLSVLKLLTLIFPDYKIKITESEFILSTDEERRSINEKNFELFKEIINEVFCLKQLEIKDSADDLNPGGPIARAIAEKIRAGRRKVAEEKQKQQGDKHGVSVISRYLSILSTGQNIPFTDLLNYTLFQLLDAFTRMQLKEQYDLHFKAQLAGAKDLQEVDHWMKDIYN